MSRADTTLHHAEAVFDAAESLEAARARQHEAAEVDKGELYELAGALTRVTAELAGLADLLDQRACALAHRTHRGEVAELVAVVRAAAGELVTELRTADATAMLLWAALARLDREPPGPGGRPRDRVARGITTIRG